MRSWQLIDYYENPGPIQFYGPQAETVNMTLMLNYQNNIEYITQIEELCGQLNNLCRYWLWMAMCRFETREDLLQVALGQLNSLVSAVRLIQG